jgi:hypothetical protein
VSNDYESPRYVIYFSDRALAERDSAYLYQMSILGLEYARDWLARFQIEMGKLKEFPGPKANAIDDEASEIFGKETRRLLYYGPRKQRRRVPYRVFFTITEPLGADDEGVLQIVRILHGSRPLIVNESSTS